MRRLLSLLILPLLATTALASDPPSPAIRAWTGISASVNACPDDYDYFPSGGMRNYWCHLSSLLSLPELEQAAGRPIFLAGPHQAGKLDLANPGDFGHYNPAFVVWAGKVAIPEDPETRRRLQPVYDQYMQPLARIHWVVWQKLQANPKCTSKELNLYQARIRAGTSNTGGSWGAWYERWFFYMNPAFCQKAGQDNWLMDHGFDGGVDGNVTKTAVGFWLRRIMDGTADEFAAALQNLLAAFDPAMLRGAPPPPPHNR